MDLTLERTFGHTGEITYSLENAKTTAITTGGTAEQLIKFQGPGAVLMWATMKKYKYDAKAVAAKFTGKCYWYDAKGEVERTTNYEETGTVDLGGTTYGLTHFTMRSAIG